MAELNINDYTYPLSPEKIALHPLVERDQSKLQVYRQGKIEHSNFFNLADYLPENSFLFFNNTKVIPARLHFSEGNGANIEISLFHPVKPSSVEEIMQVTQTCTWKCDINNSNQWAINTPLKKYIGESLLTAKLINLEENHVQFNWSSDQSFAELITVAGEIPMPAYLGRKADKDDSDRYQTVYSQREGAIASPIAGLHFTPKIFNVLNTRKVGYDFITLHISAGTFQSVTTKDASQHIMHHEQIIIDRMNINNLLTPDQFIIPVGTTSMRTLESLYWFGAKLLQNAGAEFKIAQDDPYTFEGKLPSKEEAFHAVAAHMDHHETDTLIGGTSIFIKPGYTFNVCRGLITNYHQPASTLILLVAAFVGKDWKIIYNEALKNDYRFLTYGDSSLLLP
jgi:S-adenosylmethionine:tRNA ribosyltransferase-isomerase